MLAKCWLCSRWSEIARLDQLQHMPAVPGLEKSFQYYSPRWKWTESFSRQSGSIAEISVAKSTNAEKCTTGVFLKWLFHWLAYLSQSGKFSSCKCRTLYEAAHEKRYLMAFSGKYEIFKYSCSPGFQKYAIENLFEKSWFTTELCLFP